MDIPRWLSWIFKAHKPVYDLAMRLSPEGEREYTTTEAAMLMGMTRQNLDRLLNNDRVEYVWRGGRRYIPDHALGVIKPSTNKGGRPRKK